MVKRSTNLKSTLLKSYEGKRNFKQTPEPPATLGSEQNSKVHRFVVHKHAASRLHYDLRLECEGVFRSWAIPKGPSMDPLERRLSVRVEDHPLSYGEFEGVIPPGNYGAGTVMIWDEGTYSLYETLANEDHDQAFLRQYRKGNLKLEFVGHKLQGRFSLVKIKKGSRDDWLLIKKRDQFVSSTDVLLKEESVVSGKSLTEIADSLLQQNVRRIHLQGLHKSILHLLDGVNKMEIPNKLSLMQPKRVAKIVAREQIFQKIPSGLLASATLCDGKVDVRTTTGLNLTSRCQEVCHALSIFKEHTVFVGVVNLTKKPCSFEICDLLWFDQFHVASLSFEKRWEILSNLSLNTPIALIESSREMPTSGKIWCRNLRSVYEFGGQNEDWLETFVAGQYASVRSHLTNPDKIFWPEEGFKKKDLYEFYREIAKIILPHLQDRPQSLHRHPDGIDGKSFFQKEITGSVPGWIPTTHVSAYGGKKTVTYLLCQDTDTLLYLINMGCIEINPWLSRSPHLSQPDYAVIDIDPGSLGFSEVIRSAEIVRELLEKIGAHSFCKTSGSRGLHIYVPTDGNATFMDCQKFAEQVGLYLNQKTPHTTSVDRNPLLRRNKIYIDALQNRKGQTMASVYSVRPRSGALVSTPIEWRDVNAKLNPEKFNLRTIPGRIEKLGDFWAGSLMRRNEIPKLSEEIAKDLRFSELRF